MPPSVSGLEPRSFRTPQRRAGVLLWVLYVVLILLLVHNFSCEKIKCIPRRNHQLASRYKRIHSYTQSLFERKATVTSAAPEEDLSVWIMQLSWSETMEAPVGHQSHHGPLAEGHDLCHTSSSSVQMAEAEERWSCLTTPIAGRGHGSCRTSSPLCLKLSSLYNNYRWRGMDHDTYLQILFRWMSALS